jgi:hypothetical protein
MGAGRRPRRVSGWRRPDRIDPPESALPVRAEVFAGECHDLLPFTGQSAELLHSFPPQSP